MANHTAFDCDVAIIGSGMVGATLAIALAQSGLSVVLIERNVPQQRLSDHFDGRVSALAAGTINLFRNLHLFEQMAQHAQPIRDIRVSDRDTHALVHYAARDIPEVNRNADPALGCIVENRIIRTTLDRAIAASGASIRLLCPAELAHDDEAIHIKKHRAILRLADGSTVRAALAVGAEGRKSRLRSTAGIQPTSHDFRQIAITGTIAHEKPHHAHAFERFLPTGPLAVLPMVGTETEPFRSSVVWVVPTKRAHTLMALETDLFNDIMTENFGDYLGRLRWLGQKWTYPLHQIITTKPIAERIALIGDAAHVVHPLAGQGLNLGLRDVAVLVQCITDDGQDAGAPGVLDRYVEWRRFDVISMAVLTSGLNGLFLLGSPPMRALRKQGLTMVNGLPKLKAILMRHAMGLSGDLPELCR